MKKLKFFVVLFCLLFVGSVRAQLTTIVNETFDNGSACTFSAKSGWTPSTTLKASGRAAYLGFVPTQVGDSTEFVSQWFDCRNYSNVALSFSHICKVSASDEATIEFQIDQLGAKWTRIPLESRKGAIRTPYKQLKFSQKSYEDWKPDDSLAEPTNGWWKTETFDISYDAGWERVRFKFKIKRGHAVGTQFAYGWLVDDFVLMGSTHQINLPEVSFLQNPADTEYSTGPFVIQAKVATRTIARVYHPWLKITYRYNGVTTNDSIYMNSVSGDTVWEAVIPQQLFGTQISYSIQGKDTMGNEKTIFGNTYLKRPSAGGLGGYVTVGSARNGGTYALPVWPLGAYSWTRSVYTAQELNGAAGLITTLSYDIYRVGDVVPNVKCYFKMVDPSVTTFTSGVYVNPVTEGATLVWSGTLKPTSTGWLNIKLDHPFLMQAGKSLVIYWEAANGTTTSNYAAFTFTTFTNNNCMYYYGSTFPFTGTTATLYNNRPNIRLYANPGSEDSNSVALLQLNSPGNAAVAGDTTYVNVDIQNAGLGNLKTCLINWSVNNVLQTPYQWKGNLPDHYTDTNITIGYYFPSLGKYDEVKVWVSNPNGVPDKTNFDDTITVSTFGCGERFSGDYVVGPNKGADFTSLSDAITKLRTCGAKGDVTLQLQDGTYPAYTLEDLSQVMGSHILTITSLSGNREKVIFKTTGTDIFTFSSAHNAVVSNVSFITGGTSNTHGVTFSGNNENVELRNCYIYMDTTATATTYAIYKTSTGISKDVRFIGNTILGGYYGVYFYGGTGTSAYGTDIVFDSNYCAGPWYYGYYFYYNHFKSLSHNVFKGREKSANSYLYNYMYYCNLDRCDGNRFDYYNVPAQYIYNYYYYCNRYNTSSQGLFCNNEYIGSKIVSSCYGMYLGYSNLDIYNNTFLLKNGYGIYNYNYNAGIANICNNILVNTASSGTYYPLYSGSAQTHTGIGTLDYNLYYAKGTVGYWGSKRADLSAWKSATKQDDHSLYKKPVFFYYHDLDSVNAHANLYDSAWNHDLSLALYAGMECPVPTGVLSDINGTPRAGQTVMGCYADKAMKLDAAISGLTGVGVSVVKNSKDNISAVLTNMGETTLTSVKIGWSFNGVQQSGKNWTGSLVTYAADTVALGTVTTVLPENTIKIWVSEPNADKDLNRYNDTLTYVYYGCDSLYHGTYTVGTGNADFKSVADAIDVISKCGMDGPVELNIQKGNYVSLEISSKPKGISAVNTLTIQSATGNAGDVVFQPTSNYALTLNGASHVRIKNITFDGCMATGGATMVGLCTDVHVDGCVFKATTASGKYAFNKTSGAACDSIFIQNSTFDGGYYGLYFYGQGTGANGYNTNIYIDSNKFLNAFYYTLYFYYNDLNSFSHNLVKSATNNNYLYTYFYYTNHYNTVCNTIDLTESQVQYPYTYFYYPHRYNYNSSRPGLIANNAILYPENTVGGYCMYMGYPGETQKVYHNTMYNPGNSGYAFYGYFSSAGSNPAVDFANNIAVGGNYPFYSTGTAVQVTSDNNDLYSANGRAGYWQGTACASLSAWATASGDNTSVSVKPNFVGLNFAGAELSGNTGLTCPSLGDVPADMVGVVRNSQTTIGCMEYNPKQEDLYAKEMVSPTEDITLVAGANIPVRFVLKNIGQNTVTSCKVDWTCNGVNMTRYNWSGSLAPLAEDTVTLGTFKAVSGPNRVVLWTSLPNTKADQRPVNDTLSVVSTGCDSLFQGVFTIGKKGDYEDYEDFVANVAKCGLGGPVTLKLKSGIYDQLYIDQPVRGASGKNTITITSEANNADSVIIINTEGSDPTVVFNNHVSHVILEKVTIRGCTDDGSYMSGVGVWDCDSIAVRNCKVIGTVHGDHYADGAGFVNEWQGDFTHLWIEDNEITGWNYITYLGCYNYGVGTLHFNRNYCTTRYYNFYSDGQYLDDMCGNTFVFEKDSADRSDYTYLMEFYGAGQKGGKGALDTVRIENNRFLWNGATMDYCYYYMSEIYADSCVLYANNEIIYPNVTKGCDFDIDYIGKMNFVHNSLYMPNAVGAYVYLDYFQGKAVMANNSIVAAKGSYSLVLDGNSYQYSDYNNYYGTALAGVQRTTQGDKNSVSVLPAYANPSKDLSLLHNTGLECPLLSSESKDIEGNARAAWTTMGCYDVPSVADNIMPREVSSPASSVVLGSESPLTVNVLNSGNNTVTSFTLNAVINGVKMTPYNWTGSLSPKNMVSVNVGKFLPNRDSNILVIWTSMPNGKADAQPLNDTLRFVTIGCDSILHGDYIVRNDKELDEIVRKLSSCGVDGPVTVKLASGKYNAMKLDREFINTSEKNRVTFTSFAGCADSVVLNGSTEVYDQKHVDFRHLTLDGTGKQYALTFGGLCSDMEFYGCNITVSPLSTSTTTDGYCVYKPSSGLLDSVRFIRNTIRGGYYGLYLYGASTTSKNLNLVIDSNYIIDQYYYGSYFYYNEVRSYSNNFVLTREKNANNYWYGINSYYGDFLKCDGNLFHVRTTMNYPYPVYLYYCGYNNGVQSYFTNNEIMTYTSSTYYGMYVGYSNISIVNNTVYVAGSGASRGIYVGGSGYNTVLKNNLVYTAASGSFPIYLGTADNAECDYNCLYSPSYAGYNGANMGFAAWQASGKDVHGMFVKPNFTMKDSAAFLQLTSASGLYIPVISGVNNDRLGRPRYGMTVVGAYGSEPQNLDAALVEFADWSTSVVIGKTVPVKVTLMNMSKNQHLTSAKIDWYVRGIRQTPVQWKGDLAQYATAEVILGSYVPVAATNTISARVSLPNGSQDMEPSNDSISNFGYGCDSLLNGYYTVGGNKADFANLNDAMTALNYCGVSGPTTIALADGTYSAMTVGLINGVSFTNTVTFTSQSGKASKVIVSGTNALSLNAAQHVYFHDLTLGTTSTTRGVSFSGFCKDIEIIHCDVNSSPTATSSTYYVVYKPSGTPCDSVRFIGNHFNGGYYGVYFYGMNSSAGGYNTHIIFDSNTCENAYYYPHYFYYTDFETVNNNVVLPRTSGTTYWYGYMYYCNYREMKNNRYNTTRCPSMTYWYNYQEYINIYNCEDDCRGLFANNEIIHTSNNGGYGLYLYGNNVDYVNNSVYSKSGTYGVCSYSYQGTVKFKNNNFVNLGNVAFYGYQTANMTFEANNFYSPAGISMEGNVYSTYADIAKETNDPQVSLVQPQYVDVTTSLEQTAYTGLACKRDAAITEDINGLARSSVTVRGCYSLPVVEGKNMQMVTVVSPRLNTVVACYPDFSTAEVQIANMGTDTLDFSKDTLVVHMTSDSANVYYVDTVISAGIMLPMSKMNVKLTDFFPTSLTGYYDIKAWVDCLGDKHHEDDTASTIYEVTRVVLPFETDFTVLPQEFAFDSLQGDIQWEHVAKADSMIPAYGSGMMRFASSRGRASLSRAVIKQVDLQGSSKPKLSFWYAHDNTNSNARDYMEVLASTDGGRTYTRLMTVYRYDASYTKPGWKLYQYDLSNYINETCLHIAFEAASYGGADQNVDRIQIQVEQDVEVREFIVEDTLSACDLDNRKISIVLNNSTQYDVNYERPDSIRLHVELVKPDSSITAITRTMKGRLYAQTADTILLMNDFNFDQHGSYTFRAYIDTVTLTTDVTNDTLIRTINVLPDLSATVMDEIGKHNIGDSVIATFHVKNTGNLTVNEIRMHLTVNDENEIVELYRQPLHPNDSIVYTFKHGFVVPEVSVDQPYYFLSVWAEMPCDMDTLNNVLNYVGSVSFVDLAVFSIESPKAKTNGCDSGRKQINININLYNYGESSIDSVTVHAIVDSAGTVYKEIVEKVYNVPQGNTNMSLGEGYKVPNFNGDYRVTVFVESVNGEMNSSNDTMSIEACAIFNSVGVADFATDKYTVGQNIPNPAANVTTIPYSLPQGGTVRLNVLGVNGQVLYSTELQSDAGYNEYELNVSGLSNGIYYYSMEFQGRRIVKKMNIAR